MTIFLIIFLSSIFLLFFIVFHLLFLHFFNLKKTIQVVIPFVLSNLIIFYFLKEDVLYKLFYHSLVINFSILIIYIEFLFLIKTGFTLSIITSFRRKKKFLHKELIKNYASGKGAKWILLDRLNKIKKLKIIKINKKITLTQSGLFLSIIFIFFRKILSIKDFG